MNVTTSNVNPLLPCAIAANLAFNAYLSVSEPISNRIRKITDSTLKHRPNTRESIPDSTLKYRPNTHANFLGSTLKHGAKQISNQSLLTCPVETNYQSVILEKQKMIQNVLKINADNITQELRELVISVLNISNASLTDFTKQYGTWDIGTALVVYEAKLRDNTDIFTLAIICCSLALLIRDNRQHKEIEKMNKLYAKSQSAIYQSVRYLKVLQEQRTVHKDNIALQKMIVNTLQTSLAATDNPYSLHSTLQKSQEIHNLKNKQIQSLLTIHREKLEESEYQDAQKELQIINMIVVDLITPIPPISLFDNERCMFS